MKSDLYNRMVPDPEDPMGVAELLYGAAIALVAVLAALAALMIYVVAG